MIIFKASHLLGNQLIQYCYLNTISKKNEKIIIFGMNHIKNHFKIKNKLVYIVDINFFFNIIINKILIPFFRFLAYLKIIHLYKELFEDGISKDKIFYSKGILPLKFVETGFFQNILTTNFSKINHLSINEIYITKAKKILSNIPKNYIPAFVHIRRGDYLNEYFQDKKGINLPLSYYKKGLLELKKKQPNIFFIFLSDDISFVRKHFAYLENKYISENSYIIDIAIISLCEIGIVSNSTFSLTGAYLVKNKIKIIFPKYWLGWKKKINSHPHIYPRWASIIEVNDES